MDYSTKFSNILKTINSINGFKRFPEGVLNTKLEPPNFETCDYIISSLNLFLANNKDILKLKDPHFNLIHSSELNACFYKDQTHFFGLTKGLVDCYQFVFINFLRDSHLFIDELGNSKTYPIIINNANFSNWSNFIYTNQIDYSSFKIPELNSKRKSMSSALFTYCIFFIVMHEVGHVKHKKSNTQFVYEMDADMFAVNELVRHMTSSVIKKEVEEKYQNYYFFKSKKTIFRYTTFILLTVFFILFSYEKPEDISLESHPRSVLRCIYSVQVLLETFLKNGFLNTGDINECGKQSLHEFRGAVKTIYPNSPIDSFFNALSNKRLGKEHEFLQSIAVEMNDLNGSGKY